MVRGEIEAHIYKDLIWDTILAEDMNRTSQSLWLVD